MSIVMTRPRISGRHRAGRPGLVPVTALVTVMRRSLVASWFRAGKHRRPAERLPRTRSARVAASAAG